MFQDSKIIGQGIKSFRFLCSDQKFTALNKILEDKKFISPNNGYVYFFEDDIKKYVLLSPRKNDNPDIINKGFDESLYIFPAAGFYYQFVENGTFVKKDQKIVASYEFKDGCNTHPHNFYMQFLSELGVLGFFLFFFIFLFSMFGIIKLSLKKLKKDLSNKEKFDAFIYLSIFINFFPLMPSGNFFHNWLLIIIYMPIGFYLAFRSNKYQL
jgi:O-antigen ligase